MNAPLSAPAALPDAERDACLIVNPKSFRASRGRLAQRAVELARGHGVDVIEAHSPETLAAALDRRLMQSRRHDLLVLAGDGTVQALVDQLVRLPADLPMPRLLLLGGGRTNLIADDLDGTGDVLAKLEGALIRSRSGDGRSDVHVQSRRVLVVEQSPAPVRHGFFLAGGLVDETIRALHAWRAAGGPLRRENLGTAFYLFVLGLRALVGLPAVRSPTLRVTAENRGTLEGPMRLLVATTLEHRTGGFDPYAQRAQSDGGPRITAVIAGARGFWRSLAGLLRGRFGPHMTPDGGYLSGGSERIEVWGLHGYTLDGEEFDCDPARPVLIRGGARLEFLQP